MEYFEVEQNLQIAIDDGRNVELVSSRIDEGMEHQLRVVLEKILSRYDRTSLYETLFACIVELATNGTKANMKHLFFEHEGVDPGDGERYYEHLKTFKSCIGDKTWVARFSTQAKEQGYFVRILFQHNPLGITIEVSNPLPLLDEDEARIRRKFALAMQYDDIVSFYQDHHDATEGEGLGFALNVILMKGENIDPSLFRIGNVDGQTVARIEIPLSPDFRSARD